MRQEALENEESDNQKKQEVEKLNMVDSTIFQTEKQISEFDDKLTEEDRESLTSKLEELKKVYEEKDFENMDDSLQSLNETWAGISTRLYQETSSDETEDTQDVDDVETTDVEVEEVKE